MIIIKHSQFYTLSKEVVSEQKWYQFLQSVPDPKGKVGLRFHRI